MAIITLFPTNDFYAALAAGDIIFGVGGDETLTATAGGNQLHGGDGNDTLNGGIGDDYLQGDELNNFNGLNILNGGAGNDHIVSNSDRDEIDAGSGDDVVEVWKLNDTAKQVLKGGAGEDRLVLYAQQIGIHLLDFSSTFTVKAGIDVDYDTFKGFESLQFVGGPFFHDVRASQNDDTLIVNNLSSPTFETSKRDGRGGNDSIIINGVTESGTEEVDGGTGEDDLQWNQGARAVTDLTIDAGGGSIADEVGQFLSFKSIETLKIIAGNVLGHFSFSGS